VVTMLTCNIQSNVSEIVPLPEIHSHMGISPDGEEAALPLPQ
jgi:hypothetical protein